MEFNIEDYQPVDYRKWILGDPKRKDDPARNGVNIKRLDLLGPYELEIWDEANRYQDSRNDPGHGEFVTTFAVKLLDYLPGVRGIVIPSIILHDIGWYGQDPNEWMRIVNSLEEQVTSGKLSDEERDEILKDEPRRRPHQNRSLLIGGMVLEKIGYFERNPLEYWLEIADIIGDHDTRKLPTTESGRIMRNADFMWRASYPCMQLNFSDYNVEDSLKRFERDVFQEPPHNLEGISEEIGRVEIANSIFFKFEGSEYSKDVLENAGYSKELERVREFYSS